MKIALQNASCSWSDGRLSFLSNDRLLGWTDLAFVFETDGRRFDSRGMEWRALPSAPNRLPLYARPPDCPVEWTVRVEADAERDAIRVRCVYRNRTPRVLRISGIREGCGRLLCPAGRVFHVENARKMLMSSLIQPVPGRRQAWGTALFGDSFWAELGPELHYSRSEDQPYPGLFYVSPESGRGMVEAPLTQERWYRETRIHADTEGAGFAYEGLATTRGVRSVLLPPDAAIEGEETFYQIVSHADLFRAFDDYHRELEARYEFRSRTSPNRRDLIWGSWNFGIFFDCDHDLVAGNARVVKDNFPTVRWIQIDEGWAAVLTGAVGTILREGADARKFPKGLKAVADEVRALGLRPAIWCGMMVGPDAELARRRPDLFLRRADGALHFCGRYVLDPSQEEVRDLLVASYRTLVRDWGYEGIKLDFWTYGFEDLDMVYADDTRTSLELRNGWLTALRGILPEDGYLQSGCNIWNGSPFVARFLDNIRYGIDVSGGGDPQALFDTVTCLANLSHIPPGRMWLPNSDAIGVMRDAAPGIRRTCLSFCLVTGSAMELGGDLRQENPEAWADVARVLGEVRIGAPFRPLDFGTPDGSLTPTLWFAPEETGGLLCAFNWDGKGVSRPRIGLDELGIAGPRCRATDIWTGAETVFENGHIDLPAVPERDVWAVRIEDIPRDMNTGEA